MRAVPHLDDLGDHVEILDYEKVEWIIDQHENFAVGFCSCRHKKHHAGSRSARCARDLYSFAMRGLPGSPPHGA